MLNFKCFSICLKKKENHRGTNNNNNKRPGSQRSNQMNNIIKRNHNKETYVESEGASIALPFVLAEITNTASKITYTSLSVSPPSFKTTNSNVDETSSIVIYDSKACFDSKEFLRKENRIEIEHSKSRSGTPLYLQISFEDLNGEGEQAYLRKVDEQNKQPMIKIKEPYQLEARNIFVACYFRFEVLIDASEIAIKVMNMKTKEEKSSSFGLQLRRSITIGRGEENDMILASKVISKTHIKLLKSGVSWFISDEGVANKTKNGLWLVLSSKMIIRENMEVIFSAKHYIVRRSIGHRKALGGSLVNNNYLEAAQDNDNQGPGSGYSGPDQEEDSFAMAQPNAPRPNLIKDYLSRIDEVDGSNSQMESFVNKSRDRGL